MFSIAFHPIALLFSPAPEHSLFCYFARALHPIAIPTALPTAGGRSGVRGWEWLGRLNISHCSVGTAPKGSTLTAVARVRSQLSRREYSLLSMRMSTSFLWLFFHPPMGRGEGGVRRQHHFVLFFFTSFQDFWYFRSHTHAIDCIRTVKSFSS